MRDKSSPAEPQGLRWRRVRIAWPIEQVPVLVEVVHPRKLTALEWAVLRVADSFEGDIPSLDEVAEELGIADAVFLRDTLRDVVRLRALEPREAGGDSQNLSELAFTTTGRELYRRGKIEAEPAEHGLDLFFDALTDEDCAVPKGLLEQPDIAFPSNGEPLQARAAVGLDRVREIVRRLRGDLIRGDGEVRSVRPRQDSRSRVVWAPIVVDVVLTGGGHLVPVGSSLSVAAQRLLRDSALDDAIAPRAGVTADWVPAPRCRSHLTFDSWLKLASRTLPDGQGDAEVLRLLQGATGEVLLHAGWYGRPGVAERLDTLVRSGASVVVFGQPETRAQYLQEHPTPGLLTFIASDTPLPAAVVVDGRAGLLVDDVKLRVAEQLVSIELAGILSGAACAQVREQFLGSVASALSFDPSPRIAARPVLTEGEGIDESVVSIMSEPELRERIARLMLLGQAEDLSVCNAWVCRAAPGPERVVALSRIARLAVRYVKSIDEDHAHAAAADAWRALVEQPSAHRNVVGLLARIAPPGTIADELARSALTAPVQSEHDGLAEAAAALVELRTAIDDRWGAGACGRVVEFTRFRDRLLGGGSDTTSDLATRLAAARQLLNRDELRAWSEEAFARLPSPETAAEFASWADDTELLAADLAKRVDDAAERHLRRLLAADPGSASALLRTAGRLLANPASLAAIVLEGCSLRDTAPALRALADAGVSLDTSMLRPTFEQLLPAPSRLPSLAASDGLLSDLEHAAREHAQVRDIAARWASHCADAVPPPETVQALPWWMSEMAHLRPFLGDLQRRAPPHLRRFAAAARASRDAKDTDWESIERSWQELGLPSAALLDLLAAPVERPGHDSTGGGKKGKKNRRRGR